MAYKIFFTEDALRDLEDILDYIRLDNEAAADFFGSALLDYLEILKDFPHIGSSVFERPGVRKILHSPIRIYYRINERRKLVEILHFWHGSKMGPDL